MIAYLKGDVGAIDAARKIVIVDVGGVGYEVHAHDRDLADIQAVAGDAGGRRICLYCHHHVREDTQELYGFLTPDERAVFEDLIAVSGVGVRMAMAILGHGECALISEAVMTQNTAFFSSVHGVGPKLAQRVVLELGSRVAKWPRASAAAASGSADADPAAPRVALSGQWADLMSVLANLGYAQREIDGILREMMKDPEFQSRPFEDKMRAVLQKLGPQARSADSAQTQA